jgi:hypothetical protein
LCLGDELRERGHVTVCCDLVSRDRGVEVGDCSFGMVTAVSITHELP